MEVLDVKTVESKESKDFHDISFTFGWFEILQVFYPFYKGLDSFWGNNVTKKFNLTFFRKKNALSRAALRSSFLRGVWYLVRTVNISFLFRDWNIAYLMYVIAGFFLDERIEMYSHQSTEEFWKSAQPIESARVGVLFSTDYESS